MQICDILLMQELQLCSIVNVIWDGTVNWKPAGDIQFSVFFTSLVTIICIYICNSLYNFIHEKKKIPHNICTKLFLACFTLFIGLVSKTIYVLVSKGPKFPDIFVTFKK